MVRSNKAMVEAMDWTMDCMNATHGNWKEIDDNPRVHLQRTPQIPKIER